MKKFLYVLLILILCLASCTTAKVTKEPEVIYDETQVVTTEVEVDSETLKDETNSSTDVIVDSSEEEVFAEDASVEVVSDEEVSVEELSAEEVSADGITSEELPLEESASEELTSEELTSEELTSEDLAPEEIFSEELTSEEFASEEIASEELTSEELASEESLQEEAPVEEISTEETPVEELASEELPAQNVEEVSEPVTEAEVSLDSSVTTNGSANLPAEVVVNPVPAKFVDKVVYYAKYYGNIVLAYVKANILFSLGLLTMAIGIIMLFVDLIKFIVKSIKSNKDEEEMEIEEPEINKADIYHPLTTAKTYEAPKTSTVFNDADSAESDEESRKFQSEDDFLKSLLADEDL